MNKLNVLPFFVIPIIIGVAFYSIKNVNAKKRSIVANDNFTVYLPEFVMWGGVAGLVLFGAIIVLMTMFPNDTAVWWVYTIFFSFMVLGIFYATYAAKCEVKVVNDTIYVTSYFGKKKVANFSEIKMVRKGAQAITAYTSKIKLFTIYNYYIGSDMMRTTLNERGIPYY